MGIHKNSSQNMYNRIPHLRSESDEESTVTQPNFIVKAVVAVQNNNKHTPNPKRKRTLYEDDHQTLEETSWSSGATTTRGVLQSGQVMFQ